MRETFRTIGGAGRVTLALPTAAPVAELQLRRPRARNALSGRMLAELDEAVEALAGWQGSAVVIHGGESFCAGADLKQIRQRSGDGALGQALNTFGTALLDRLRGLPLLTVAAIEGAAVGGGAELALACDLRVMARGSILHFVHARLGLTPGWGSAGRLTAALGRRAALKILLSARPLSALSARALGLADRVCPPGGAVDAARALIEETIACDPAVARRIKAVVAAADTLPADRARAVEQEAFQALWGGPAQRAALKALKKGR